MTRNIDTTGAGDRAATALSWTGGWLTMLALPLWASQLTAFWFLVGVLGAAGWTVGLSRRRGRMAAVTAVVLWATLGVTAGVQYRLAEVAGEWPRLQREIEERGAEALNASLDGLVRRGESAVGAAEVAVSEAGTGAPVRGLFDRLEQVRVAEQVSALAVFTARGAPVAWAGEHRGAIPLSARLGREPYVYHEGPLFSYLYFTRAVEGDRTAVASVLLESTLVTERGNVPFAEVFAERLGLTPRFYMPRRAQGQTVWDWSTDRPILSVSFAALSQQYWWERVVERGRRAAGVGWAIGLVLLGAVWYAGRMGRPGVPVAVATAGLVLAPLGQMVGSRELFSPLLFVLPVPGDVTLGVLLALLLGVGVWMLTRTGARGGRRVPLGPQGVVAAAVFTAVIAVIDRSAANGLLAGTLAGGLPLQLASTLLLAIPLYLLLRSSAAPTLRRRTGVLMFAAGLGTAVALALWLLLWWSPGRAVLPWTAALWAIPFLLVSASAPAALTSWTGLRSWVAAGLISASAVLPHLWVMHSAAELENAEVELASLGTDPNPFLDFLLREFADTAVALAAEGEVGTNLLYHGWVGSGLAAAGHEAHLTIWRNGRAERQLALSRVDTLAPIVGEMVSELEPGAEASVLMFNEVESLHYLLLAPLPDGRVVSVAVPPRTTIGRATPLARFLHPGGERETTPYNESLYLIPAAPSDTLIGADGEAGGRGRVTWTRTETGWRSEARAHFPAGWMHAHLFVRTPATPLVLVRAALAAAALIAAMLALWLLARLLCGELEGVKRLRGEWLRSFRGRLTVTLFLFFLFPTAIFGAVAYGAVAREVVLSSAAQAQRALEQAAPAVLRERLPVVGSQVGTDLLLYRDGMLVDAAAPETLDLGLFHSWLTPGVFLEFASGEDTEAQENRQLGENDYLVAYRRLDPGRVLAAPIPLASQEITRRQREFRDIALLVSLLGAAFSIFLSLQAARALSRPLAELSQAAVTVGGGDLRVKLPEREMDEFGSVYHSFNQMVQRLRRARADLAREARRTETIVDEAATGVLALDAMGRIELVNPRAAEILGVDLDRGEELPGTGGVAGAVRDSLREFRGSAATEAGQELELDSRIIRLRLRKLTGAEGLRGTVVALEDVTSEVRTARVLAWGEMARQVAHEIKNPLTPIKLSVQHLRRAYSDRRPDFAEILERNVDAVLEEIDRLGEIARAFARFGAPQQADERLEAVDVASAVRETLALYRSGGPAGIRLNVELDADEPPLLAVARAGELKEVLINLLENAREALSGSGEVRVSAHRVAGDGWIELTVEDSGEGIEPDQLHRIFDPQFSTRTSGTGLGLAIVRRLVESWGGAVEAWSEAGVGTRIEIRLLSASAAGMPLAPMAPLEPDDVIDTREGDMGELKKGEQRHGGRVGGVDHPREGDEGNRGAEFGTSERATRGTNRDADESGESKNQGHGHPREERGE